MRLGVLWDAWGAGGASIPVGDGGVVIRHNRSEGSLCPESTMASLWVIAIEDLSRRMVHPWSQISVRESKDSRRSVSLKTCAGTERAGDNGRMPEVMDVIARSSGSRTVSGEAVDPV